MKTYVVGTHSKRLGEALLMSTNNICFMKKKENYQYFLDEESARYQVQNKTFSVAFSVTKLTSHRLSTRIKSLLCKLNFLLLLF